jgi:16S rRNA processing protein RimM
MANDSQNQERRILLGKVHGAFGVRGELRVESFTDPETALLKYAPLIMVDAAGRTRELHNLRGKPAGKGLTVAMEGVDAKEAADALRGALIYTPRSSLPPPAPGEYYWVDLEGLDVYNLEGVHFGRVAYLTSTGANDVMVVEGERERWLPFKTPEYVTDVNFETRRITVDWDADF